MDNFHTFAPLGSIGLALAGNWEEWMLGWTVDDEN